MSLSARVAATLLALALTLPASASPTMKAIRIHAFGGPEVLQLEDAPRPEAQSGEVLIKVHAAGVNPVDWKIRQGMIKGLASSFPVILGYDISGVIESVGEGVTTFKAGDEVFAYLSLGRGGGYAEYAAVPITELALKPANIDHTHAAAVPLAALTAWQALFDNGKLQPGQTVLIHAGAGGVGHFAIQIAKAHGARVIATASAANHDFLKELGADEVIDYRTQKFEAIVKDIDIVLDPIGGDTQDRSYQVIKPGGHLISIVQPPSPEKLKAHGIEGQVMLVQPNGKQLAQIAALITSRKIKPNVSKTFPLTEIAEAHKQSETGHTRGKIVLELISSR